MIIQTIGKQSEGNDNLLKMNRILVQGEGELQTNLILFQDTIRCSHTVLGE